MRENERPHRACLGWDSITLVSLTGFCVAGRYTVCRPEGQNKETWLKFAKFKLKERKKSNHLVCPK